MCGASYFYPRPPRGGRLRAYDFHKLLEGISIHALREEGDHQLRTNAYRFQDFYPRPPRGGRPRVVLIVNQFVIISIHALREEGDILPIV